MPSLDAIRRLTQETYGTADALLATGTPDSRFKMRLKDGRLPISAAEHHGTGNRRRYHLSDVYVLRLVEVLSGPHRHEVSDAVEIVRQIAGHDLALTLNARNLDGSPVAPDGLSALRILREVPPEEWPEEWRSRDLSTPWWVAARHYAHGWRAETSRSVDKALRRLPRPETPATGGSVAVVFNLTAELAHVDAVLTGILDAD